jgi:phosphatidylglycerol:prolipoprotein diacylglycerol transferase
MNGALGVSPAYVAVMIASVVVALFVARRTQQPLPISRAQRLALATGALVGGAFFAKLPYLFGDLDALVSGRAWLESGRTLTLGLVGGYLGVEVAKLVAGVRVKTGDGFVVPVAVGVGLGRIGCFVAGCCFGTPTTLPWGVRFHDGVPRHPTQLYEAAFHVTAGAVLHAVGRRGLFPRQRIKLYFLAYFVYRFFTEWLREEPRLALGLTLYQLISLGGLAVFLTLYAYDAKRAPTGAITSRDL